MHTDLLRACRPSQYGSERVVEITGPYVITNPDAPTESLAKDLAIKLAVSELEKLKAYPKDKWQKRLRLEAEGIVINLLIGLYCQEVVKAWEQCT